MVLKDFSIHVYRTLLGGFVAFSVFFGIRAVEKLDTVVVEVGKIKEDVAVIANNVTQVQAAQIAQGRDIHNLETRVAVNTAEITNLEAEIRIPR